MSIETVAAPDALFGRAETVLHELPTDGVPPTMPTALHTSRAPRLPDRAERVRVSATPDGQCADGRDIRVWWVPLDPDADRLGALRGFLDSVERARVARFRYDRDRRAFVAARGGLREILGARLGVRPEAVRFRYGARGKPEVEGGGVRFNLSHAGRWAVVAVAHSRRVGVDVEPVRVLPDADAIAERFFSDREVAAYRALPAAARPEAFFACWTRKEAFIKALGDGLRYPLDAFDVPVDPAAPGALLDIRDPAFRTDDWELRDVPAPLGYRAALVAEGSGWHLLDADGAPSLCYTPRS